MLAAIQVTFLTPHVPGRDDMVAVCRESVMAQTVPVLHFVEDDPTYTGIAATVNRLVDRVETPWISVLSDDDVVYPEFTEKLLDRMSARPGCDVYYAWCNCVGRGNYDPNRPYDGNFACVPVNGLFRTDLIRQIGGWRSVPLENGGCDIDLLNRILAAGGVFDCLEERLWEWRFHGSNMCMNQLPQGRM